MSDEAKNLLRAFNQYLEASSRSSYVFSLEEQRRLQEMLLVLDNHIKVLIDYELSRGKEEK